MMQYILKPTEDDVLHSAKGTTWKNHKYVDIVTKNGKRVYKYGRYLTSKAKSKITGKNAVTNKDSKYQYNPNIKTTTNSAGEQVLTEPWRTKQYEVNTTGLKGNYSAQLNAHRTTINQKVITEDQKKYGMSTFEDIIKRYKLNK